ncbi:MAG: Gfo/Idh/MocA family oxidoreductase [Caldilineaceae bacterium]|nr:Gfo/Idh/MocA family oxidoreductase [Caldilineaceae bacterium]
MQRIGIGIIGGGGIAAEGHISGYQLDPRCEVVALWDTDVAKTQEQAQRLGIPAATITTSLENLLQREDIQAVSICTPDYLHGEHAYAALQAGKHVLIEKPMTTTRAEAARLVQTVRATGLVGLVGQIVHFQPDYQAMVAAYRAGELGDVWLVESDYISDMRRYYGPTGQTPWRSAPGSAQDILLGGGCHSMGILQWALDSPVQEVFAYANHKAEPLLPINDCYLVSLRFANGVIGKLIAASGNRGAAPTGGRLVMYGTNGTLWGSRLYRNNLATHQSEIVRDFREEFQQTKPRVQGVRQVQYWAEQCAHFLDCIAGKAQPLTTIEEGARIVAALSAAIESARTGQPILVDNAF